MGQPSCTPGLPAARHDDHLGPHTPRVKKPESRYCAENDQQHSPGEVAEENAAFTAASPLYRAP